MRPRSSTNTSTVLRAVAAAIFLAACEESASAPPAEHAEPSEPAAPEAGPLAGEFAVLEDASDPELDLTGVIPTLSDLPIPVTKRTLRYVEQYAKTDKGRDGFATRFRRSKRFEPTLVRALQERRFPEDLAYVVAIESGFNPRAVSPKGAAGLWQMMPPTAERFGLAITDEIDERRSIPQSTDAAMQYLEFLYERYLSWDLALAGYNCGEGCVDDAIARGREVLGRGEGGFVSFPELASHELLPAETREFVAQIHAFAIVAHNREVLDFDEPLSTMDAPLEFAEIAVPPATRLSTIARLAGLSLGELQELNPQFSLDRVPAASSDVLVYVPPERLSQVLAGLPSALAEDQAAKVPAPSSPRAPAAPKLQGATTPKAAPTPAVIAPSAKDAPREKAFALAPAPFKPGAFVVSSGALVTFKDGTQKEPLASAEIRAKNPLSNRAQIGDPISVSSMKLGDPFVDEVRKAVEGDARALVRKEVVARRKKLFEKTSHGAAFEALSSWAFPSGHPDAGLLLVGPTDPADDMFLEPEPTWSFEVLVTVDGAAASSDGARIDALLAGVFTPKKLGGLPRSKVVAEDAANTVLVAFASPPAAPGREELVRQLAFEIVCHNKLGRLHEALRRQKKLTTDVLCAMESTPHAVVSWVLVSPQAPHDVDEVERAIDEVLAKLSKDGVTETELASARGLVRAEAAREVQTATMRGHPKSRVEARNAVLLRDVDATKATEVTTALGALLPSNRRFVWRGPR